MKVNVLKTDGTTASSDLKLNLDSKISDYAISVLTRVARQNVKQGTKKVKTRSEVTGRAAKPFKQKGTGNARQGSRKGPHMRGGGIAHGPMRDYSKLAVNKKFSATLLRKLLSKHAEEGNLNLIELTGEVSKEMKKAISSKSLVVYEKANKPATLKLRNIKGVSLIESASLSASKLLNVKNVYIDLAIQEKLEKILK